MSFPVRGLKPYYEQLRDWLFVSHNPDGTIREDVITDINEGRVESDELIGLVNSSLASGDFIEIDYDEGTETILISSPDTLTQGVADTLYPDKTSTESAIAALPTTYADKTETDAAIARVDPGSSLEAGEIISSSDGVSVGRFSPGRIDARIRGLSTAATAIANTAVLEALAAESGSEGSEVWIPEGVYDVVDVELPANARLNGRGTLRTTSASTFAVRASGANVEISNVTVDGSSLGGGIYIDSTAVGARIHDLIIQNLGGSYPYDAINATLQVENVRIERVGVFNAQTGIRFNQPRNLLIEDCYGDGLVNNFITLWCTTAPALPVEGITIRGNRAWGLGRMLIELVTSTGATTYIEPVIEHNEGYWSTSNGSNHFGISTNRTTFAQILHNVLIKADAVATGDISGYGVELVSSDDANVHGNYIRGFSEGIIPNVSVRALIDSNVIRDTEIGIRYNGVADQVTIINNRIYDPRDYGLQANGVGSHIVGNLIRREATWADDASRTFIGILAPASTTLPTRIERNDIELIQATPSVTQLNGLMLTGTASTRMRIARNTVRTTSTAPFGRGIVANSGATSITGYTFTENVFRNLSNTVNTGIAAGTVGGWGNINDGSTSNSLPSGIFGLPLTSLTATATLDFGSIAAGATANLTITVTGASTGDTVHVGPPSALEAGLVATGYVSASNTVTVRLANVTASSIDPASATWRATVVKA